MRRELKTWLPVILLGMALVIPGIVLAADVADNSVQRVGNITVNASVPHIVEYMLYDAAVPGTNVTNTPIDARNPLTGNNKTYVLRINATHGLDFPFLNHTDIYFWYDGGVDPGVYDPNGGAFMNFNISYNYDRNAVKIWKGSNEVSVSHVVNAVGTIAASGVGYYNISIFIDFTPLLRWAPGDGLWGAPAAGSTHTTAALNDVNSWNFHVLLYDDLNNLEETFDEFGIYKYADASYYDVDQTGGGAPGQSNVPLFNPGSGSPLSFYFQSNAPHKYDVQVDANALIGGVGPDQIPADQFSVNGGDLLGETYFPGAASPIWVLGDADEWRLLGNATDARGVMGGRSGTDQTSGGLPVTWIDGGNYAWEVDIPAGIAEGSYTTTFTYSLTTSATPNPAGVTFYGNALTP